MKNKFLLKEVAGEYLLVPLGSSSTQFNSMITMNETGAFIWKRLDNGMSTKKIAEEMILEYNVSLERAESDIIKFKSYLESKKVL